MKGGYLDYRLQKNIIEVVDTSYSGREGVREITEKGHRQATGRAVHWGEEDGTEVPR